MTFSFYNGFCICFFISLLFLVVEVVGLHDALHQFVAHNVFLAKLDFLDALRGYLCGSAWRAYKSGVREICGVKLPEGMKENQKFPEPIITPTTKAEIGEHDQDISKEEILAKGLATPEEYALLEQYTLALFKRGTEIAAERGLILVDTKYEFGKHNGTIYLMDEIHTPDSSRYFYSEGYEERFAAGEPRGSLLVLSVL